MSRRNRLASIRRCRQSLSSEPDDVLATENGPVTLKSLPEDVCRLVPTTWILNGFDLRHHLQTASKFLAPIRRLSKDPLLNEQDCLRLQHISRLETQKAAVGAYTVKPGGMQVSLAVGHIVTLSSPHAAPCHPCPVSWRKHIAQLPEQDMASLGSLQQCPGHWQAG